MVEKKIFEINLSQSNMGFLRETMRKNRLHGKREAPSDPEIMEWFGLEINKRYRMELIKWRPDISISGVSCVIEGDMPGAALDYRCLLDLQCH